MTTYPRATAPDPSPQAHWASNEGQPAHRCAQTADHLNQKQPKTPISSEVDCTLGQEHNTTNNNQQPSKHPLHKPDQATHTTTRILPPQRTVAYQTVPKRHPQQPTPAPKTQTTSTKTTIKQPLRPRWSTFWADYRREPSSPVRSIDCRTTSAADGTHADRLRARG